MSVHELVHVLYSDYGATHFLINRNQCPASVYAEETYPMESGNPYFMEKLFLNSETVPLFNLHNYLINLFRFNRQVEAQLVILTPLELLSEESVSSLKEGPLFGTENCRRLGVRISSETLIKQISLGELQPHTRVLRSRLKRAGFPATHPLEGSMGYLIDLDKIIAKATQMQQKKTEDRK
ncbi:MAG: hypothetical protein R6V67_07810 [Spirochaetia bacterium]